MHLESLRIEKFRCLNYFDTALPQGRILIVGDNAQGKTSLLEAIYYLVTGRSFRTRYDNECLPWQEEDAAALIRGNVLRDQGERCRLTLTLGPGWKNVMVDGKKLERLADLWGKLRAVIFTPDDLELIKGGPGARRRFLDVTLGQIEPAYLYHLQRYQYALRQRNAALKQNEAGLNTLRAEINPWTSQVAEHGAHILLARSRLVEALEPRAARLYHAVARHPERDEQPESFRLVYQNALRLNALPEETELTNRFRDILEKDLEEDRRRGQTGTGPHRDDFLLLLNGKNARDFASQGQARSAALALRLAEGQEMEAETGEAPLLLLDDLASELDHHRKRNVLYLPLSAKQTFLTTTRREDFPADIAFDAIIELPLKEKASLS